jgi:hypothetical protein
MQIKGVRVYAHWSVLLIGTLILFGAIERPAETLAAWGNRGTDGTFPDIFFACLAVIHRISVNAPSVPDFGQKTASLENAKERVSHFPTAPATAILDTKHHGSIA